MEITKTVPVTIQVKDGAPEMCDTSCPFCYDAWECQRYADGFVPIDAKHRHDGKRSPSCIAEFGTGKKETITLPTWESCKDGDVVLVRACENTRTLRVKMMEGLERCQVCYFGTENLPCPFSPTDESVALCETHPSGGDVYFTEVKE